MTITKEYCDRCGKEVKSNPVSPRLFPIICKSPKGYIRFRESPTYSESNHVVCKECLEDFWAWWYKK